MTSSQTKTCQNCQVQFTIEPEDFEFYEKMGVLAPVLCPECRFKRKAQFRNECTLYNRSCDLCKQSIISMYHPRASFTVYCYDCWYSDKWDPLSYGYEYDPEQPFFEQLQKLTQTVPKNALYRSDVNPSINSPYENFSGGNKDCYFIANSGPEDENCAYSRGMIKCRDVFDCYFIDKSERAYEGISVHNSASVSWGQNVFNCLYSTFLLDCADLQSCFGCVNLRHKKYYFFNEPFSKEEYQKKMSAISGSYHAMEEFYKKFHEFSLRFPRRANNNLKSVDVSGNYIFESKSCHSSFELSYCENVNYAFSVKLAKDAYDIIGHGRNTELLLEVVGAGYGARIMSCWWVENVQNVEYCFSVRNSQECFGCDGLKNKKFAILNKCYTKEQYLKIKATIVKELQQKEEYGLFFPPVLAFFAYNETIAQDNMPVTKEEALAQGYRWEDNVQMTIGKETMKPVEIPDHIKDIPDTIINEILACVSCGRNYKIIPAELQFYRVMTLPLPRKCFYCRHSDRIRRRGPMKLYNRTCDLCKKPIKTNYAPERPEIVYCEACYQQEVI